MPFGCRENTVLDFEAELEFVADCDNKRGIFAECPHGRRKHEGCIACSDNDITVTPPDHLEDEDKGLLSDKNLYFAGF